MKRRSFLKNGIQAGAVLSLGGLGFEACRSDYSRKVTILHTNDVHSHIDPFPVSHAQFPNLGGVARRAGLLRAIREDNRNVLLLDAGDIFQGTPYFNFYGGELEFRLMSRMGYDAATIGNHDFDNGLEGLLAQLPYAKFPFVSSNYDFSKTLLDGYVEPYRIFEKDGIRIGVFGLGIGLEGLVNPKLYGETRVLDPYEIALDTARILREEHTCSLVICLSHLGYKYRDPQRPSDTELARRTEGIDLIIGGHTHTFMEKADVITNRAGRSVLINQVGCYGVRLGRVDFFFKDGEAVASESLSIEV